MNHLRLAVAVDLPARGVVGLDERGDEDALVAVAVVPVDVASLRT